MTACKKASEESADNPGCGIHVNAVLGKDANGDPCIAHYTTSDWYDGTTVQTYVNGFPR